MPIPWLGLRDPFPPVDEALTEPNGLLAAGGDLSPERLLDAYARGIFPWFNEDDPVLWWSPDPRMVLFPSELHVSRTLRRTIRAGQFSVTLDRDFDQIPNLTGTITDSHFVTRDRMGRSVAFLARLIKDGWASSAHNIAVDEATAILVEPTGAATRVGTGAAYFMSSNGVPAVCVSGTPLTYTSIPVYKVSGAATFNLATWTGSGGLAYTVSVNAGALTSSKGTIY
jgi:hypothetical protein